MSKESPNILLQDILFFNLMLILTFWTIYSIIASVIPNLLSGTASEIHMYLGLGLGLFENYKANGLYLGIMGKIRSHTMHHLKMDRDHPNPNLSIRSPRAT